ncbi:shikimate dehydrogenase [soil metagenome]
MTPASRFAGILGWPLDKTLSPVIHTAAFQRTGVDGVYLEWPVPPEQLAAAIDGLRALGALGANITMPHKEEVVHLMDALAPEVERVGAVNTIVCAARQLTGHNTDVSGFGDWLEEDAGVPIAGGSALVLGSGGAARAVVCALADRGAERIAVAARRPAKAEAVAELAAPSGEVVAWEEAEETAGGVSLVVNATPLGREGQLLLPGARWRPGQVVVDLLYEPPTTPLVEAARRSGAQGWGGLGMLVRQAAESFRLWTGRLAPVNAMSAAAVHALGTRSRRPT